MVNLLKFLWIVAVSFFVCLPEGRAGRVTIQGVGVEAYAGVKLSFLTWSDMITYSVDTLMVVEVKEDGTFEGNFEAPEAMEIFVHTGVYEIHLFIEPGGKYRVTLPPRKDKTMKDILNPYFKPVTLPFGLINTDRQKLNRVIQHFEEIYSPYFYRHARDIYAARRDTTLASFVREVTDTFAYVKNPFFIDYMKARLAMLKVMSMPLRASVLEEYRDFGQKVLLKNPAYMELFNQIFNRYFNYLLHHHYRDQLVSALNSEDRDSLRSVIMQDLGVKYDDFVDLVSLKGIYDAWYNHTFSRKRLLSLLGTFSSGIENPGIGQIAGNIYKKFTYLQAGSAAPAFSLPDILGQTVSLYGYRGKYVYLNFSSRLSYSSLRQFPLLDRLKKKYGDILEIITVALENNPAMLKEFVRGKEYSWPFLVCSGDCNLPAVYLVKAYPTYYLIDPEGNLVLSHSPAPTENFEAIFRQVLSKKRLKSK